MKDFYWKKFIPFVGLLGALFGFYTYFENIKEREPTFIIDPVEVTIIPRETFDLNNLMISDSKGEILNDEVTITRFYFFNQGKESIKQDNILEPLRIKVTTAGRIIDYDVLKFTRSIVNPKLEYDSITNGLLIEFDILEYEDGFVGQIVFSGERPQFLIEGIVEGAKDFKTSYYSSSSLIYIIFVGILIVHLPPKSDQLKKTIFI